MGCFEVKTSQKSSKVFLRYVCMFKANFLHKNTNGSSRAYCYFAFSRSNSEGSKKTNLKRTNIMSICCRGWIMLKMTLIKKGGSNKKPLIASVSCLCLCMFLFVACVLTMKRMRFQTYETQTFSY